MTGEAVPPPHGLEAVPGGLGAVPGVRVGHARVPGGDSGCTVVLGPFRGAVEVLGMAAGTRELGVLDPRHLVPRVDAVVLTGGSAHGLAAAQGVMAWLEERGRGFETPAGVVPLVPAAVLYDLAPGRGRPGAEEGRRACEDAWDGASGPAAGAASMDDRRRGAGCGATVGKLAGPGRDEPGGLGERALRLPLRGGPPWTVGALAVVNALGDVLDGGGRIVAGARDGERFLDSGALALNPTPPLPGTNTSLAVVATDAPVGRVDLARIARMASSAFSRRIRPVFTPFDGDVLFVLSTGGLDAEPAPLGAAEILALGEVAVRALEGAITRAAGGNPEGEA